MKKLLSIVLVVFTVLLWAAGCASPRVPEPSSSQVPTVFHYQPTNPHLEQARCKTCDCYRNEDFADDCYDCENGSKYKHILIEKDESEE